MKLKNKLMTNSNISFLASGIMTMNAIKCPCPTCIGLTLTFFANGVREKINERKK